MTGVALITGAAGDIGSAAARALQQTGSRLVLADHPAANEKLEAIAASLAPNVRTLLFDVTRREDVSNALESLESEWWPTSVFNNAGIQGPIAPVHMQPAEDVAAVMTVNVIGMLNVIAEVSRRLIDAGRGGAIVNTASMAGVGGAPNMAAYSASKAAVIAATKSSAKDLAPYGIRVNAISPAFIGPGAMWDRQVQLQADAGTQYYSPDPSEVARQMIAMVPLRRFGSVGEVASVVAFLLSDDASYLTGVNIEIAGGSV